MMSRSGNDLLFYGKELGALIRTYEAEICKEVESWERNKILAASEPDLIAYLVEKFTLDVPRLIREQIHIESEGEARINVSGRYGYFVRDPSRPFYVPGSYVTVALPFEGDGDLFGFQASTYTLNPPCGRVYGSAILISFQDVKLDPERIRQEIDNRVNQIEQALNWVKNDCDAWHARVQSVAEQYVRDRKRRVLEQADLVSALGLPLKRRPDAATTSAIPMVRKKRPVVVPPTPKKAFKPEPALPDTEYNYILDVIDRLSQTIERNPTTFVNMKEEQIRDLILVNLNGHYEGHATGETFNGLGKSDILIRASGRNVFVAECKFWSGSKAMHAAINQILGYLTWRDTKAALLVFSKNSNFTNVLTGTAEIISQHPNFKRELRRVSDTHTRYLFRQRDDSNRDLYLAVQVFNIPRRMTHGSAR